MQLRQKMLGQNFLVDQRVIGKIVSAVLESDARLPIIEIGPGKGAITKPLVASGRKVMAIEKDEQLYDGLEKMFENDDNFMLLKSDFMKVDLAEIIGNGKKAVFAGNLPYSVASRILVDITGCHELVEKCVLMFQKEVADRIISSPNSRAFGLLSVMSQTFFTVSRVLNASPSSLKPAPRIHSTVLSFEPIDKPQISSDEYAGYLDFIKRAFSKRRKKLKNCLPELVDEVWTNAGIDNGRRAESLAINEFITLFKSARITLKKESNHK